MSNFCRQCNYLPHTQTLHMHLVQKIPFINSKKNILCVHNVRTNIRVQQGLIGLGTGLGLGLALGSVQFNWFVLVLWTIMWRCLLNQCSYGRKIATFSCKFSSVWKQRIITLDFCPQEINCNNQLFSVRTDGNQGLNFAIFHPYEH